MYNIWLIIYRLVLSPIAKFPGSKFAAVTFWYEFYYDVILGGQYEFQIARSHEKYGPVVRINPCELHIDDPDYMDTVYPGPSSKKINKWPWVLNQFGMPHTVFAMEDHDIHKSRRAAFAPMFSKRAIAQLESYIAIYVQKFVSMLKQNEPSEAIVNLSDAFSSLTCDIVSEYCFGQSTDMLASPQFQKGHDWRVLVTGFGATGAVGKQFSFIPTILNSLPERLAIQLNPVLGQVSSLKRLTGDQIKKVEQERASGKQNLEHRVIFHDFFDSHLPSDQNDFNGLVDDGFLFMIAGTATTADVLSVTCFHLLNDTSILERLTKDISDVARQRSRSLDLQDFEGIPYLEAVIKEGLRMAHGVVQRLARVHPFSSMQVENLVIPAGTPVSMSSWMQHMNPKAFPEPHRFNPSRWLDDSRPDTLDRHLIPFGRGTRQCLGLNLAYAELFLTLGAMFGPSGPKIRLHGTSVEDVTWTSDKFVAGYNDKSEGIRVKMIKESQYKF